MIRYIIVTLILLSANAYGASFYCDPVNGDMSNDGSSESPWTTIQAVIAANKIDSQMYDVPWPDSTSTLVPRNAGAPVQAGDTIYLRSGYHGSIFIQSYFNASNITITNDVGHTPTLRNIVVHAASNWIFDGLSISPEYATGFSESAIVFFEDNGYFGLSYNLTVSNCDVFTVEDTTSWSAEDWTSKACFGFWLRSDYITIDNNTIYNVRIGIYLYHNYLTVTNNTIDGFQGDAISGRTSDTTIDNNLIKNVFKTDPATHNDGIQLYGTPAAPTERVTITRNTSFILRSFMT